MQLHLHPAEISDLAFIVEVYNTVIPGRTVTADLTPKTVEDWTPWFHQHNNTIRPIWILKVDDKAVGWLSFSDYKARAAYNVTAEISIYIAPEERAKSYGKHFIELALSEIYKRGVKNILAVIYAANTPSVKLFKQLHFEQWGLLPKVCEVEGEYKDVLILGRRMGELVL